MANLEIDLQDGDGVIVSVAQADPNVWANLASQATQLASNAGFGLIVYDRVFNSPERTLDSIGAVQNWLASQSNVGAKACPSDIPAPSGYAVWQGAVPPPLTAWAVQLLKSVSASPFGTTWTQNYGGANVVARVDVHTWHYLPDGTLLTGLCWKGITLYRPFTGGVQGAADVTNIGTATPDPTLAVYDNSPTPAGTSWGLVAVAGGAILLTIGAFVAAIKLAGRPRLP